MSYVTSQHNWRNVRLGEIIELKYGKGIVASDRDENGSFPIYGANGILGRTDKYLVEGNAIVIGRKGSAGEITRVSGKFWPSDVTYYVLENENIDIDFLFYLLKKIDLKQYAAGIKPGINRNKVYETEVYIPPIQEQKEIVKNTLSLIPRVQENEVKINGIKKLITKLKQAILASATTGKLTEDWREQNNNLKSQIEQIEIEENVPDIPTSWVWTKLGTIAEIKGGVTKGRNLTGKKTISLPYLRVANVQDGYLDLSVTKEIDIPIEEKDKYLLKKGDILFTEGGDRDKLGRGTIWYEEIKDCIHQNHIFRARINNSDILPEFISLVTKSEFAKEYFFNNANQIVNLASINITVLKNTPVSIPPLEEQKEIIIRIQKLLELANRIEKQLGIAEAKVSKLTQSVLSKTFNNTDDE